MAQCSFPLIKIPDFLERFEADTPFEVLMCSFEEC